MQQRKGIRVLETIRVLQPVRTSSQDTNYKFSGFGATATAGSASATSVSTTSVATIDALSRSSTAPWPAHWPLTALFLGLNENSDTPSTLSIDPDTTMATVSR